MEQALERYHQRRRDRGNGMVKQPRQWAEMIHGHNRAMTQQWDQQLAMKSRVR